MTRDIFEFVYSSFRQADMNFGSKARSLCCLLLLEEVAVVEDAGAPLSDPAAVPEVLKEAINKSVCTLLKMLSVRTKLAVHL